MVVESSNERRDFTRIRFDAETRLSDGQHEWQVELRDISLNGMLVSLPDDWPDRTPNALTAILSLAPGEQITMQVSPAHREAGLLGLRCDHIDLDSISHLRRLVELNTGDSSLLDRELTALSHLDAES